MLMKYAIQHRISGQLVDYCENPQQADKLLESCPDLEVVNTINASKVEVVYTELSGPHGYGHQEPSFTTYGGLLTCIRRLCKWMQEETRVWGPDPRDVKDYFKNCRLYINGEDKFDWWYRQVQQLNMKTLYV